MTEYKKLVKKLCEVEQIKNDIDKIKFGKKVEIIWECECNKNGIRIEKFFLSSDTIERYNKCNLYANFISKRIIPKLEERHLRWYFEEKFNINLIFSSNGISYFDYDLLNFIYILQKYDTKKPFCKQSEEIYAKINKFLDEYDKTVKG